MTRKTDKGVFSPTNPQKYMGGNLNNIQYRSGWEHTMMALLDRHPNVVGWASESISIPYRNPLTGRWSMYVPDFLVVYVDKEGRQHSEMIEIKPLKETPGFRPKRMTEQLKLIQTINAAKWQAAMAFCAKRGLKFRVATEDQLFAFERKK